MDNANKGAKTPAPPQQQPSQHAARTGTPAHGARPKWVPVAVGLLGFGLCILIYRWLFRKSCKHYKQSYICSRRTVEAIRCYPVQVPIEDDDR